MPDPQQNIERLGELIARSNPATWDLAELSILCDGISARERGRLLALSMQRFGVGAVGLPVLPLKQMLEAPPDGHSLVFDAECFGMALSAWLRALSEPNPAHIAEQAKQHPIPAITARQQWKNHIAANVHALMARLIELPDPRGIEGLARTLAEEIWSQDTTALVAARLIGDTTRAAPISDELTASLDHEINRAEFKALLSADSLRLMGLLGKSGYISRWRPHTTDDAPHDLPAYRDFAKWAVTKTLAAVRAIHSEQMEFRPDKLMPPAAAHAVARAMRLALSEGLDWGCDALDELWRGAAVAPNSSAKTMPSQSLTIALGHEVVAEPRPQAVLTLQTLARDVRHAGVQKKLKRFAKAALADCPTGLGVPNDREPHLARDLSADLGHRQPRRAFHRPALTASA